MMKFLNRYWWISKSQDGLWWTTDKHGNRIQQIIGVQMVDDERARLFIFTVGRYTLRIGKPKYPFVVEE